MARDVTLHTRLSELRQSPDLERPSAEPLIRSIEQSIRVEGYSVSTSEVRAVVERALSESKK